MLRLRLFGLATAVLAVGCGGGGGGSTTPTGKGAASFHIVWTSRTAKRVVPLASQSVVISLSDGSGTVDSRGTIVRPTSTWTSASLSPGHYTFQAAAYSNAAGTGVAQATGSGNVTITANANTTGSLTMGSTVKTVALSASSGNATLGTPLQVTATAQDASGNTVLVDPSTLAWSSSDTTIATVSSAGLVTPVKLGACTISATFNEVESSLGQTAILSQPFSLTVQGGTTTITIH